MVSRIYDPDAPVDDLVFPEDVPSRDSYFSGFLQAAWQSQIGWAIMLGLVVAIAGVAYWLFAGNAR